MASFSPYTVPQEPAKWVNPLDLNMVYKDISHKDDIAKQNLYELQQISNQLSSLPAFGADSEMLSQKLQKLKGDMSGLNLTNLGDYNTISQIKGLMGSFKNDEEVLNAIQRGSFYKQEIQKKKDDPNYISPGLDAAEEYYGSGKYIADKRFSRTGWKSPEMQKLEAEYLKNVPKVKTKKLVGGNWVETEGYDQDQLNRVYDELYSREDVSKTKMYELEKAAKAQGVSFSEIGRTSLQKDLQQAQTSLLLNPNNGEAKSFIEQYNLLLEDDQRLEQIGKQTYLNKSLKEEKEKAKKAAQYISTGTITADAFAKDNQVMINNIREYERKKEIDARYEYGVTPDDFDSPEEYYEAISQKTQSDVKPEKLTESDKKRKRIEDSIKQNNNTVNTFHIRELNNNENETVELTKNKKTGEYYVKISDAISKATISEPKLDVFLKNRLGKTRDEIKGENQKEINASKSYQKETYTMEELISHYGSKELADSAIAKFNIQVK